MRKLLIGLTAAAMLALTAAPALAIDGTGTAHLTFNVAAACQFSFPDGNTLSFGDIPKGTTSAPQNLHYQVNCSGEAYNLTLTPSGIPAGVNAIVTVRGEGIDTGPGHGTMTFSNADNNTALRNTASGMDPGLWRSNGGAIDNFYDAWSINPGLSATPGARDISLAFVASPQA